MDSSQKVKTSFHHLSRQERLAEVGASCNLTFQELEILSGRIPLSDELLDHCIENSIGSFSMPFGVAHHFEIDGKKLFIPMVVEESSIIAAASATAKWIVQSQGTLRTYTCGRWIIGQIQLPDVHDTTEAILKAHREQMISLANAAIPGLVQRGGGIQEIEIRTLVVHPQRKMLVLHLLCDPCDVMGANVVNQACETLRPWIQKWTQVRVGLCILSNLVDQKLVGAEIILKNIEPELAMKIQEAALFAEIDPYRAATHNKGVLNGIDPILIATGNDWRAVEAGVHAYAALQGSYRSITSWKWNGEFLRGHILIPMAVGVCGGMTRLHPTARIALKILKVTHAEELARICVAVGLVQNLGALTALVTVGIVNSHMKLHVSNLALAAGAESVEEITYVSDRLKKNLVQGEKIHLTQAKKILEVLRASYEYS